MRRRSLTLLVFSLAALAGCQTAPDDELRRVHEDVHLVADATTIRALVPQNATIESLLRQQQVTPEIAASVVEAVRGVFNPRHLRVDQSYWVTRQLDGLFREFRYQIDADKLLRVVFRNEESAVASNFAVDVVTLPKEYRRSAVTAEISPRNNSLIGAFSTLGEKQLLPMQLAEMFAGEVDFNSDLQQGDRFTVLFDRAVRDGAVVGYGDIQAAVIEISGRRLTAYRFPGPDGQPQLYDENGQSMRRQFLRTPLPFDPRVTSGFSMNRFHPVHGRRRPHLGVDFGAPTGTPVLAVAGGVVTTAAWSGEAGRLVRLRHAGGYETLYLHLNGFAQGIRAGVRVEQGQRIGYVGSTGTATGPHLDYRVVKNGTYLNPMTAFGRMPAGEPVAADLMSEFIRVRDEARQQIEFPLNTSIDSAATPVAAASLR